MNIFRKTNADSQTAPATPRTRTTCGSLHNVGRRRDQQDSFAVSDLRNEALKQERGIFLTLADGMGGMANGAAVSSLLVNSLQDAFLSRPLDAAPDQWLLELLGEANRKVNDFLEDKDDSGSTLVAALIQDDLLWFLSVGDSRIYLARGGGMISLTREHNFGAKLDLMLLKDILPASALMLHPQRRALTSFVGMGDLEGVDRNTVPIRLLPGDTLFLLSDGVFNTLTENEILSCLCNEAETSALRLERLVLEQQRPHQDNFTAIIYQYEAE